MLLLKAEGDKDKLAEESMQPLQKVFERSNPLTKDSKWWQKLIDAVGNFVTSDMQPLSVVENRGFQ